MLYVVALYEALTTHAWRSEAAYPIVVGGESESVTFRVFEYVSLSIRRSTAKLDDFSQKLWSFIFDPKPFHG